MGASISGGASLATGGNSYTTMKSADLGKNIAENAVENNYLSKADWQNYEKKVGECNGNVECIKIIREEFATINKENSQKLKAACQLGGSSSDCAEHASLAKEGFDFAYSTIKFDHTNWMSGMMRTGKNEGKAEPSTALLGSEFIPNLERMLSDKNVQARLEKDPEYRSKLKNLVDIAATAVREEKENAYEFGTLFQYPNIKALSEKEGESYKVFGIELPVKPVSPEFYVYSTLGAGKMAKNIFDLSSASTKWVVGANGAVSASAQYLKDGEISIKDTAKDMAEAWITKDFSFGKFLAWNAGTGFAEGYADKGELGDGLENAKSRVFSSSAGYLIGKKTEKYFDSKLNTFSDGFETELIHKGGFIFKYKEPNILPTGIGNSLDAGSSRLIENWKENNEYSKGAK